MPSEETDEGICFSWMRTTPSVGSAHMSWQVEWFLGDDVSYNPQLYDEIDVFAADGSVVLRAPLNEGCASCHGKSSTDPQPPALASRRLRSGKMQLACPPFGGSYTLALTCANGSRRIFGIPVVVEGPPAPSPLRCIRIRHSAKVHPQGRIDVTFSMTDLYAGRLIMCNVSHADNDSQQRPNGTETLISASTTCIFLNPVPPARFAGSPCCSECAFAVAAPISPGEYHFRYLKSLRSSPSNPLPHTVAVSPSFVVCEEDSACVARSLDLTNPDVFHGTLQVFPEACAPGERLTVSWDFEAPKVSDTEAGDAYPLLADLLSPFDAIRFYAFGHSDTAPVTESLSNCVKGRWFKGAIVVRAPNVPGLFDIDYFAFFAQRRLILAASPLRVLPPCCRIQPVVTSKADVAPLQQWDVEVSEELLSCGLDCLVLTDEETGGVVARARVPYNLEVTRRTALIEQVGLEYPSCCFSLRMAEPFRTIVANFNAPLHVHYYSATLQRLISAAPLRPPKCPGPASDPPVQPSTQQLWLPKLDLLSPHEVPVGESIAVRIQVFPPDAVINDVVVVVCSSSAPAVMFRADIDDPGAIQCLSSQHYRWFDQLVNETCVAMPGSNDPQPLAVRAFTFSRSALGMQDDKDRYSTEQLLWNSTCDRICVAEARILVCESVPRFDALAEGTLPVLNAALTRRLESDGTHSTVPLFPKHAPLCPAPRYAYQGSAYEASSSFVVDQGVVTVVPIACNPNYRGAIIAPSTVTTTDPITVTLHLLEGACDDRDSLVIVDEKLSTLWSQKPLSEGIASATNPNLVTLTLEPLRKPAVYLVGYFVAALQAVVLVSKALTVTAPPTAPPSHFMAAVVAADVREEEEALLRDHSSTLSSIVLGASRVKALLVGCTYRQRPFELHAPDNDTRTMRDTLGRMTGGAAQIVAVMREDCTSPSLIPTAQNVRYQLGRVAENAVMGDTVLFYFSGYGTQFVSARGECATTQRALLPCDFDWDTNMITYKELEEFALDVSKRGAIAVLIVDAGFEPSVLDVCRHCGLTSLPSEHPILRALVPPLLAKPTPIAVPFGVEKLQARRMESGMHPGAQSKALLPPAGYRALPDDRHAMAAEHLRSLLMPTSKPPGSAPLCAAADIVLYEAGRGPVWEAPSCGFGTRSIFTAALCEAITRHQEARVQEEQAARDAETIRALKPATYEPPRISREALGIPWNKLHDLVLRSVWCSPYRSQKPEMWVSDAELFLQTVPFLGELAYYCNR